MNRTHLAVMVDGVPLAEDEARALWQRFSDWMEVNRGDLGGFAAQEGFASVHPGVDGGRPVLLASRTDAQRPYAPATAVRSPRSGGSPNHQTNPPRPSPRQARRKK